MAEIYLDPALLCQEPRSALESNSRLGSHNVESHRRRTRGCRTPRPAAQRAELQMLHGMADQLKYAAIEWGDTGLRMRSM